VSNRNNNGKSLESWIWDAACSIRGAQDAPKYKDFILPLVFTKRLCDVFDDEVNRIAEKVGSRAKAFKLVALDPNLVRFNLPLQPENPDEPVWTLIRKLSHKIGEQLTTYLRDIARANPLLQGIIDRVDFNATTHGQRDIDDDRLSNLIEKISEKRLGLTDVEPDIIGRSYEYLIRKFAEGSGQSAGEFYTPKEVGIVMAKIMDPEPGMTIYDPCCGSAGLLIKCQIVLEEKMSLRSKPRHAPLRLFGQEYIGNTWAMANMNMIIHDMEGKIEIGDTFRNPKFREGNHLQTFDRVVANPMWNQDWFTEQDYDNDEFGRFPPEAGCPGNKADWGWIQHIAASLNESGKAAIVMGTGSASRGSGESKNSQERMVRRFFVDNDLIEAVILLPFNLFYNTDAPGLIYVINKSKLPNRQGRILFINASHGFVRGRPKNILDSNCSDLVSQVYKSFEERDSFSRIVDAKEIQERDYNLRPSRYVFEVPKPDAKPINQIQASYAKTYNLASSLADRLLARLLGIHTTNNKSYESEFGRVLSECRLVPLSKLVKAYNERAGLIGYPVFSVSKVFGIILQGEKFGHAAVASKDKSNYKVVKSGMFAYDPMLLWDGSIGLNRYSYDGIVSPAYTVFRLISDEVNPDYLDYVLRSSLLIPFYISVSDGTNMRRRKAKFSEFCSIRIPLLPDDFQTGISDCLRLQVVLEQLLNEVRDAASSIFRVGMNEDKD